MTTEQTIADMKAIMDRLTAERDELIKAHHFLLNQHIEAVHDLQVERDALREAVRKRDEVIEVLKTGKCPDSIDKLDCISNCETCKGDWIKEQLK